MLHEKFPYLDEKKEVRVKSIKQSFNVIELLVKLKVKYNMYNMCKQLRVQKCKLVEFYYTSALFFQE